eukprot:gnl/Chilomastix_caulleri/5242.p1 GENE.gnl/Chilomastix_caulleri/5242~~gnl/Chilomastix_caulleri/5242.p1  ORF type:complete len:195 (+),score=10.18 gnl/Chilomastix_caulleri/5242:92-676(+)
MFCGCTLNSCVFNLTPRNATIKGMRSYRNTIRVMFGSLFITFITTLLLTIITAVGPFMILYIVGSSIFTIAFTPSHKTMSFLKEGFPRYANTLFKYNALNWILGSIVFICGVCSASLFNGYHFNIESLFSGYCLEAPIYELRYERRSDGFGYYVYKGSNHQCTCAKAGLTFVIATSIVALIQMVFRCLEIEASG